MKAEPTDEESAAIAVALQLFAAAALPLLPERPVSRWRAAARREGVEATLPVSWNG